MPLWTDYLTIALLAAILVYLVEIKKLLIDKARN